jgi:hypothetical protein
VYEVRQLTGAVLDELRTLQSGQSEKLAAEKLELLQYLGILSKSGEWSCEFYAKWL